MKWGVWGVFDEKTFILVYGWVFVKIVMMGIRRRCVVSVSAERGRDRLLIYSDNNFIGMALSFFGSGGECRTIGHMPPKNLDRKIGLAMVTHRHDGGVPASLPLIGSVTTRSG